MLLPDAQAFRGVSCLPGDNLGPESQLVFQGVKCHGCGLVSLNIGRTHLIALPCIVLDRFLKKKTEGLFQPCARQVYQHHFFQTALTHFKSLCHILVILAIFQTFSHDFYL